MEHYSNVVKAMIARSKARAADIADKIQARAYYQFQYVPPAGPLPGYAMEQQTEDAINEIGNIAYSSDEIAREAREIAQQAYNAAQAAIEMANNAITAAQNAQQTADTALNTANTAVSKADNAQASADAAQKAADAAQKSANDAQTSANNAQSTADTAIENASQALSAANEAKSSADQSNQRLDVLEPIVDTLRWYENITDNIDFNTHVELERAFLQGTANTHGPVAGPGWLDVDDDYNETYIRQKFIAQANGACYVRFGTIVPDSSPIEVSSWTGWVKYALASELTSAVKTINNNITSINGEITTIKGNITSIEGDITELQESLGNAEGDITTVKNALDAHKADYNNPHKVTAAQLGLATVYKYKGSVETYADLPTSGQKVGDVYNVKQADPNHKIKAGDNVAWDGTAWDILAGDTDLSGYAQLNSANTFTAANTFRANIAVSNGTAAGTGGSISFGISPTGETVQTRISADTLGGLFYNTSTNQPHIFRTGNNIDSFAIRDDGTTTAFSNNNNIFATVVDASGVAKWLGNANTATKLETARTINGVPFDGTQNITIEAGQGEFLPLTGGTVTGPIYLPSAAPTTDTQAVTKKYVDDSVAGAGGGSNLTTYTSLEQLGITPGQETFASIHSALPINSVLEYYVSEAQNFADIYPASYGNFIATRLTEDITIFHFTGTNQIIYVTHYHVTANTNPSWTQIAKQSDLTNLSNSVVKSVNGIKPTNGNVTIDIPEPVIASEAEAKAGTNNTKFMTPLRVAQAIDSLDGNPITGASISGKTITLTKKDGSKITLNTQDTNTSNWSISKGTNGWARENSTGLTVQWGYVNRSNSETFTFPRTFTTCYYSNVMCSSNLETFIKARSNTSITFNTGNGYNDDIKNWGDCYIFAIGVS